MRNARSGAAILAGCVLAAVAAVPAAGAVELAPLEIHRGATGQGNPVGRFSGRTISAGIEVDREGMRLIAYTLKPYAFENPVRIAPIEPYVTASPLQVEVALLGPGGLRYTQRIVAGPLCFDHGPGFEPHVEGDTIRYHRDSFVISMPALDGFDRIEVSWHREPYPGEIDRVVLGSDALDRARFTRAGTTIRYEDVPFADPGGAPGSGASLDDSSGGGSSLASSTVIWPEDIGDSDVYRIDGSEDELLERINIVIVPDGYRSIEKALMESHADSMIAHFRAKSPHAEHDPFINYTLVYAYSVESGTDECDCSVVKDTAMGTRFPLSTPVCGHSDNRCLSYGGGCDTSGTSNIIAAELRAPAQDETVVMVNTTRYGGCGGSRATFAAGNVSATELAVHELGHSMGGLADEYAGNNSCGSFGGEINASIDGVNGAWPEWIGDLGAPREGARYYNQCIYRPENDCEMRNLNRPFCAVCKQHYSHVVFGHPRVGPTAPIRSIHPPASMGPCVGVPAGFSMDPRLSSGPSVTNEFEWRLQGPGFPSPTVVGTGSPDHTQKFTQTGAYTLTGEITADTNFVKPAANAGNQKSTNWTLTVTALQPPVEVPPPGSNRPLRFENPDTLIWGDTSAGCAAEYNLYRGEIAELTSGTYGSCEQQGLVSPTATVMTDPPLSEAWFYLVTGENTAGEGPMGNGTGGPRTNAAPCN